MVVFVPRNAALESLACALFMVRMTIVFFFLSLSRSHGRLLSIPANSVGLSFGGPGFGFRVAA
jgi:hypothetical protein